MHNPAFTNPPLNAKIISHKELLQIYITKENILYHLRGTDLIYEY